MTVATFTIAGREYVVIPKDEYRPSGRRPKSLARRRKVRAATPAQRPAQWLSANWSQVLRKAKANTKRLTGKAHL